MYLREGKKNLKILPITTLGAFVFYTTSKVSLYKNIVPRLYIQNISLY